MIFKNLTFINKYNGKENKNKLRIITLVLDLSLAIIFLRFNVKVFDILWIISTLFLHFLFLYGLQYNNRQLLDILHYFVCILPTCGLFLDNIFLKILSLLFVILIQFLWIYEKKCILNEKNDDFGFGDKINYYFIILTVFLSINVGYSSYVFVNPLKQK